MPSNAITRSEVSPLRHVRDITTRRQGKNITAYETYCALPSPPKPYNNYDYAIVAQILKHADAAVAKAYKKGTGSGVVTLQSVLQAYEQVLPRHGIKPDEDTYYYRLLLKLSLDPEPDWWAKLNRETGTNGGRTAFFPASASGVSSNRSTPRSSEARPTSVYRTSPRGSPARLPRSIGTGTGTSARLSAPSVGTTASVRSGIPSIGGGRVSARASSYRSSTSLARSSDIELRDAIREATAQVARLGASWEASQDAAGRNALLGAVSPRYDDEAVRRVTPRDGSQDAAREAAAWATREAAARAAVAQDMVKAARAFADQAAWNAAGREEQAAFVAAQVGPLAGAEGQEDAVRLATARHAAAMQAAARHAASRLEGAGYGAAEWDGATFAGQQAALNGASCGSFSVSSGRVGLSAPSMTLTEGSLHSLAPTTRAGSASVATRSIDDRSMPPQSVALSEGGVPSALFYSDDGGEFSEYCAPSSRYPSATSHGTRNTSGMVEHGSRHPSAASLGTRSASGFGEHASRYPSATSLGTRGTSGVAEHGSTNPTTASLGTRKASGVVDYDSRYPSTTSLGSRNSSGIAEQGSLYVDEVPSSPSRRDSSQAAHLQDAGPSQRTSRVSPSEAFHIGESVSLNTMFTGRTAGSGTSRSMADAGGAVGLSVGDGSGGGASGIFDSVSMVSARTGVSGYSAPTGISSAVRMGASAKSESGASTAVHACSHISSVAPSTGTRRDSGYSAGIRGGVGGSMRSDGGVSIDTRASGRISGVDPVGGVRSESGLSAVSHASGRASSINPSAASRMGSGASIGMHTSGRISPVDPIDAVPSESGISIATHASGRISTMEPTAGARSESISSHGMRTSGRISGVEPVSGQACMSGPSFASHASGRHGSAHTFAAAPSESAVSMGTHASGRSGGGNSFVTGRSESGASVGTHASRRTNAMDPVTGMPGGSGLSTESHDGGDGSMRSNGGVSAGARTADRYSGSMRSDGGGSAGTRAGAGGGIARSHSGVSVDTRGNGRGSASDPIDGAASDIVYIGSASEYRESSARDIRSATGSRSGIPAYAAAAPDGFAPDGVGVGSRHGSERSVAPSARQTASARSIPASNGGGSAYSSSTMGERGYPVPGPGRESNFSASSHHAGSGLSSARSTMGYSSRVASSSFAGFRSDAGDSDFPGREAGDDLHAGGAAIVSGSEASFREAAARASGGSFSAPASPHGARGPSPTDSLRRGSSITAVPRGPGSVGSGAAQGQSYGAWSDGGGGKAGSVAADRASAGAIQSSPSSRGGSDHPHAGIARSDGGAGGGRAYRDPGDDDGFSFHSGVIPGSVRSAVSSDGRPRSSSDGAMRVGVASGGGFGHVSGGGAESFGPGQLGVDAVYTPFAAPANAYIPANAAAGSNVGGYGYGGSPQGAGPTGFAPHQPEGAVLSPGYSDGVAVGGPFPWAMRSSGEAAVGGGSSGGGGYFNPGVYVSPGGAPDGGGGWAAAGGSGGGVGGPHDGDPPSSPDEESGLPEEAEAYMDFSRMARAFRTWRRNTSTRQMSRSERDQALHNWAVATSFWAVQLLRRCFYRWRGLAPRKALMAMSIWGDNSRAGCFRRWLVFTRYLRSKTAQGIRIWRGRLLQRSWRHWRQYTGSRQRKARAVRKAQSYRNDCVLRGCWRLWQAFTADKRRKELAAKKALYFWTDRWLRICWLEWRQFTVYKRRMTLAMRRALMFWSQRGLLMHWLEWRQFTLAKRRKTLANNRAQMLWTNRRLRGSWMAWRLFTAGKRRKMLLVALAVKFWMGSSIRGCWREWREYTAKRQEKAVATKRALDFWSTRTRRGCLRWWRQYAAAQQHKTEAMGKALDLWMGRTLSVCWATWTQFTAKQQRKALGLAKAEDFWRERTLRGCFFEWILQVEDARRNWQLSGHMHMRRLLTKWHLEAHVLAKLSIAHDSIQHADHRRLLLTSVQALMDAHSARNEASNRLRAALMRLQNRRLLRAFNKLRAARVRGQWKREKQAMAMEWWASRCLARSWAAWRGAQDQSIRAMEAAREFALKVLRPLLRDVFYGWLDWHEDKMLRRSRDAEGRRIMDCRRQRLVLRAWRASVLANRHLIVAAQLIMRNEVQRLMGSAFRQLRREHDFMRREADARRVVQRGAARRCLRHWKALGHARQVHEEWRAQRLRLAAVARTRRVLTAWLLVACLHAEHERLVTSCLIRSNRRRAAAVVHAWRERVLHSVTKRMKMLAALLAWERGLKVRAWRSWSALWEASRASASRFAMAARYHRTRRLGLCFGALLALWRHRRELAARATRFRFTHAASLLSDVLTAWRQLIGLLRWKNMRMRRAVTHARHRLLAGSLYGWFYLTRDRVTSKQAVAVAVLHWVRRRRAAALAWWRVWAVTERALRLRCEGYVLVRAARTKAWVLLMLRANVVRNARIAGAVAHRERYMARLALSGWLLRTLLAGEWVNRLRGVAKQLSRQLLAHSLAAWLEFLEYRRRKEGLVRKALHYWRLGRQRSALDSLRWHATQRQIMRAAVARGRQGAACRVLRAWRAEADYRRGLRDRFALMVARSRRTSLKLGLSRWRAFLALRAFRRERQHLAEVHHLRGIAGRAFRCWYTYHMHLRRAKERAQAIIRRWRRRDAAEALAAFAENVVFQRQMRDAAAFFRSTCTRRALTAWREFMVVKRATDFWSHNRLTEVVAAWRQYALWRRGLRAVGERVALRWRSLTAAMALAAWRDFTLTRRRLIEIGTLLANRTTRSALAAMLFAWLDHAAWSARIKRNGVELAARVRANTLSSCLVCWHAAAARRAGLRRTGIELVVRLQRSSLASAFGFWCWHAANRARLRLVSEQVAARLRRGRLAAALAAWCSLVARAARLRSALGHVLERVRRGFLAAAFAAWRGRAAYASHLRSNEGLLAARLRAGTAGTVLTAWHAYAAYRAHLRVAERHVSTRLQLSAMAAVFEDWHARAAYKARLRRAERHVSRRLQLEVVGGLFGAWRERARYKARLKSAGQALTQRRRRRTLLAALGAWRRWAVYKGQLSEAETHVARRQREAMLAEVCGAWRERAAYTARLRRAAEAVGARVRRRTLTVVYGKWRAYASRMAALKNLLERVLVRTTALAFYGWRETMAEAQRWRGVQEGLCARMAQKPELGETACYAVARLRMWPLSVAFYTWYDTTRETRYLRDRATEAVFTYAGGLMRKAWATWLAYALRRRHLRQKLTRCRAAARVKMQDAVISQWRHVVLYHGRLRLAAAVLRGKVDRQLLRSTLALWRDTAFRWAGLKGILARTMARMLSLAWEAWMAEVHEGRERAQAARSIAARWTRRDLADALLAWRRLVAAINAARRLLARAQRRRLEWAWAGWQEVVFQEGVARGGALHERQVARRVLRGWHGLAADTRRGEQLKAEMQQRLAHNALMEWRRQWLARASCRRLYWRRTLLGWHERTQELRAARARLWHATRVVLFGCLARCFSAWWQHTQAMGIKRAVFVRKQRALAEALRRGDELAARRNAELAELAFRAWLMRASIGREVRRRQAALHARAAAAICAEWHEYARVRRARTAKKDVLLRRRLLARPLAAWRQAAAATTAKLNTAAAHRRAVLLDAALTAWQLHHGAVAARRGALRRALAAGAASEASALRARAWEGWCEFMVRRMALWELVEQAYQRRCRRMLGEAFDVWLKYTQAMRSGGIDPGSPYLTPRDRGADRWLVTRMAALAGNEHALPGPESASLPPGLLDGLYPSSALKHALERRQEVAAFLAMARHTASAGGARAGAAGRGTGGTPATAAATAALTSAMLVERQRQRERRDSHGSASASASASMAGSSLGGSALTSTLSSGAGGADLADLALQVVRATPALSPAGKTRAPTAAGPTQYAAAAQRVSADLGVGGSPYDDRLDLRALYDIIGPHAGNPPPPVPPPVPFGGFSPARPPGNSPLPLPRAASTPANPSSAAHIAPRRIDFTAGRGAGGAPSVPLPAARDGGHSYYGYYTPSRSQHPHQHTSHQYHLGPPYSARGDADSDVSSTTSSDLLGPAEARARARAAAAATAAAEAEEAAAMAGPAVSSWRRGATPAERGSPVKGRGSGGWGTAQGSGGKGRGAGTPHGSGGGAAGGGVGSRTPAGHQGTGGGRLGPGGGLAGSSGAGTSGRQTPGGRPAAGGGGGGAPAAATAGGGFRGSILDRRAAQGR